MDPNTVIVGEQQTKHQFKLVDLPPFLLDLIFMNLDVDSLTNVADVSKNLTESSKRVFKIKYKDDWIENYDHDDKLFSKQLIRFGPLISRLFFCGTDLSKQSIANHFNLMMECCSSNLTRMRVLDVGNMQLKNEFPLVQKLRFYVTSGNINESWTHLNECFPNLKTFKIDCSLADGGTFNQFAQHIPSLQRIKFIEMRDEPEDRIAMAQILNVNPQVTYLKISFTTGANNYPDLGHLHHQIHELDISESVFNMETEMVDFIVGFSHLKRLTIHTYAEIGINQIKRIASESRELIEVTIITDDSYLLPPLGMATGVLELIRNCKTMRLLTVKYEYKFYSREDGIGYRYKHQKILEKEFESNIKSMVKTKKCELSSSSKFKKYSEDEMTFTYVFLIDSCT